MVSPGLNAWRSRNTLVTSTPAILVKICVSAPVGSTTTTSVAISRALFAELNRAPVEPAPAPRTLSGSATMSEPEATSALQSALDLIRGGRYDDARSTLRQVSKAMANTPLGREADKGTVAIYNARCLAEAQPADKAAIAAQARRNLSTSMWARLF